MVSYLTEELVRQGHDVTLYASGDSVTSARLISPCRKALRLDKCCVDPLAHHIRMLDMLYRRAREFDLVHFHIDYLHFPLTKRENIRSLTTLHGRLDIPDLEPLYNDFSDMPVVSISDSQREPLPWIGWQATVPHGLPLDLLGFQEKPDGYLAFLGRISPEKRVDRAIEIARRAGMKIRIAAKVDPADKEYFKEEIEQLFSDPLVEYIGEIGEAEKSEFVGQAQALLFPIDWPEPFGMVMIEAMACGTPVIAFNRGSVQEVIEDGVTGFVVEDIDGAVRAVKRIPTLSRRRCRDIFEERFSARRMAEDYVSIYERLLIGEPTLTSAA